QPLEGGLVRLLRVPTAQPEQDRPDGGLEQGHFAARSEACSSCRGRTVMSPRISASMPITAAAAPGVVVMHGMSAVTAALRISYPSIRAPLPCGVLITRLTWPEAISDTASGPVPGASKCLRTTSQATPYRR